MGLHVTTFSALPLTIALDRIGRGPSPCQCRCPDGPLPITAFSRGFLRLECNSTEMVVELERSAAHASSPLSSTCGALIPPYPPWPSGNCPCLLQLLVHGGHRAQTQPLHSCSLFSSSPLVVEVLFPQVLSGCFSLGKVQVVFYNKGITVFSLSWKSNKRKYLFKIFPAARSQLDTCDSSRSLYFFFQCVSIKCLSPKLFDSKNNSNG